MRGEFGLDLFLLMLGPVEEGCCGQVSWLKGREWLDEPPGLGSGTVEVHTGLIVRPSGMYGDSVSRSWSGTAVAMVIKGGLVRLFLRELVTGMGFFSDVLIGREGGAGVAVDGLAVKVGGPKLLPAPSCFLVEPAASPIAVDPIVMLPTISGIDTSSLDSTAGLRVRETGVDPTGLSSQ